MKPHSSHACPPQRLTVRGVALAAAAIVLLRPFAHGLDMKRLSEQVNRLQANARQRASAPPRRLPALEAERQALVAVIRAAADAEPRIFQAQYAVGRGLLSSGEEALATVYADKAADLAAASGDKPEQAAALTLAAVAYEKAGDHEAAADRAKRALWIAPQNSTALGILMRGKSRPSPTPAAVVDASNKPLALMSAGAQKAAKLVGEGQRMWPGDRQAALRLFDEAVAADARNAAARAARARARLETGDFAGALEDAEVSLQGGPSGEAYFVKGAALLALGRRGEEMTAAFESAAGQDPRYAADAEALLAKSPARDGSAGAPAPAPAGTAAPDRLVLGAAAVLLAAFAAGAVLLRRRSEDL